MIDKTLPSYSLDKYMNVFHSNKLAGVKLCNLDVYRTRQGNISRFQELAILTASGFAGSNNQLFKNFVF